MRRASIPTGPWSLGGVLTGLGWLIAKLAMLSGGIVLVETANAKMRLFRVPELLMVAFILSLLALILYFIVGA